MSREEYLTPKQVAAEFPMKLSTVYAVLAKKLPTCSRPGIRLAFRRSDVVAYFEGGFRQPAAPSIPNVHRPIKLGTNRASLPVDPLDEMSDDELKRAAGF